MPTPSLRIGRRTPASCCPVERPRTLAIRLSGAEELESSGVDLFDEARQPARRRLPRCRSDLPVMRFILIGRSDRQHLVVVAHVERGAVIRIVSARPASRRERNTYEEDQ